MSAIPAISLIMLPRFLSAMAIMALCVTIHCTGLTLASRWLFARAASPVRGVFDITCALVLVAGWTIVLHIIQIGCWAAYYTMSGALPDFTTSAYFSVVTYTTTGYGDVLLPADWRLIGGVEAITGILMCGLSTGFYFAIFTRALGFLNPQPGRLV